jgi:hypothetical protein
MPIHISEGLEREIISQNTATTGYAQKPIYTIRLAVCYDVNPSFLIDNDL